MSRRLTERVRMLTDSFDVLRFQKILIALILVFCIGAQWPILQSVAWMRMLVTYSREGTFETALVKTFDGKHPCKLCKLVTAGKQAEKKKDQQTAIKKIDLFVSTTAPIVFPTEDSEHEFSFSFVECLVTYPPAFPPPKLS